LLCDVVASRRSKQQKDTKIHSEINSKTMCEYSSTLLPLQVDGAKEFNNEGYEHKPIPLPSQAPQVLPKKEVLGGLLEMPKNDEDFKTDTFAAGLEKLLLKATSNQFLIPLTDDDSRIESDDIAAKWRDTFCGDTIPTPIVEWKEMTSDDAVSKLAFGAMPVAYTSLFGAASHNIPSEVVIPESLSAKIVYQNDCLFAAKYETREAFFKLGAICLFDAAYQLVAIYIGDGRSLYVKETANPLSWQVAKQIWLATFFVCITLKEHLIETHCTESSALAVAVSENLATDHPLRRFLKPFTYRTHYINYMATKALLPSGGMVHRAFPFPHASLAQFCIDMRRNYRFKPFLKRYDAAVAAAVNDDKVFPIHTDVPAFYDIMYEFVSDYMSVYYTGISEIRKDPQVMAFWTQLLRLLKVDLQQQSGNKDGGDDDEKHESGPDSTSNYGIKMESANDLYRLITDLLCVVTSAHLWYGAVSDYLWLPSLVNPRVFKNGAQMSLQTWTLSLVVAIATGFRMPALSPQRWTHLILPHADDEAKYLKLTKVYQTVQEKLLLLEEEIEKRNKDRRMPLRICCVSKLGCSVNI